MPQFEHLQERETLLPIFYPDSRKSPRWLSPIYTALNQALDSSLPYRWTRAEAVVSVPTHPRLNCLLADDDAEIELVETEIGLNNYQPGRNAPVDFYLHVYTSLVPKIQARFMVQNPMTMDYRKQ